MPYECYVCGPVYSTSSPADSCGTEINIHTFRKHDILQIRLKYKDRYLNVQNRKKFQHLLFSKIKLN